MTNRNALWAIAGVLGLTGTVCMLAGCNEPAPTSPKPAAAKKSEPVVTGLALDIKALKVGQADAEAPAKIGFERKPQGSETPFVAANPKESGTVQNSVQPVPAAAPRVLWHPPELLLGLLDVIRPHADEAPWARIPWITDLEQARKLAAAEGKPLFVWSAAGDPVGCT